MSDENKVVGIRPGIGPMEKEDDMGNYTPCPPHDPHPISQTWVAQEPNKVLPTAVQVRLCKKCGLVYWIEVEVRMESSIPPLNWPPPKRSA